MEAGNIATQVLCKYLMSKNVCILNLWVGEWGKFHQCTCSCNLIYFTHNMSVASGSRSETPESFEMWCWRRMEKISWTDHVRNEEVLRRVKEQRNILHAISKQKADWIGHIMRRNCLLQQVIEGKIKEGIEVTER